MNAANPAIVMATPPFLVPRPGREIRWAEYDVISEVTPPLSHQRFAADEWSFQLPLIAVNSRGRPDREECVLLRRINGG
jgi:hypothetical protein